MQFRLHVRSGRRRTFRIRRFALFALLSLPFWASTANVQAHGVDYRVERGEAAVVHFSSQHDDGMAGAGFRVFPPDGQHVFVSGNTDVLGRAVFVPDAPGTWRLLMATEDGHGAEVEIVVDEDEVAVVSDSGWPAAAATANRLSATAAGVGYLLGLGGLLVLWRQRRSSAASTRHG